MSQSECHRPPKAPSGRLPVMVWIHGGSFIFGSSTHPVFDMVNLVSYGNARGTPVVAVSINYRVGLFGFLASSAIKKDLASNGHDGAGNFGLTDQQTALSWIQTHIASFGGDPENVTIFGESAGGMSVAHHIWSSRPAIFHRAISMSGSLFTFPSWSLQQHEKRWEALLNHFKIDASATDALDQLRAVSQEDIAKATCAIEGTVDATGNPCDDGLFHGTPASLQPGPATPPWLKAYMIGDVRHEGMIFTENLKGESFASLKSRLSTFLSNSEMDFVFEQYGIDAETPDLERISKLETMTADACFVYQDRIHAQSNRCPTFAYHIDQQSTLENPYKGMAYHAIDLLYVFLNLTEKMSDGQIALAKKISADWLDFACGKQPWEPYNVSKSWMIYGPDDKFSVLTEEEDNSIRRYSRMDALTAAGIFDRWWQAMDYIANVRWRLKVCH